jgi:hypothetical protein
VFRRAFSHCSKCRQVTNPVTNQPIDYYEVDILPFQKEIFSDLASNHMVGYEGMSPGPTFIIEKGRETVVRFTNQAEDASVIHLHGSYSVGHNHAVPM